MPQANSINPAVSQHGAATALHHGQEKASTRIQENMPPGNSASTAAQLPASQSTTQSSRKRSLEEIYGTNWLLRLSSLPSGLYTQTIVRGDSVYAVTRWLLAQPDRGGMQSVGEWTLHKYLNVLAKEVKRRKRENPPPSPVEVKSRVVGLKLLATPLSLPRRRGNAYQSMESFLGDRVAKHNRVQMLLGLFGHYWEQLERLRMTEEHYHHDLKLPTHPLCRARAQIGQTLLGIMKELRENDALDLAKARQASGGPSPEPAGPTGPAPVGGREADRGDGQGVFLRNTAPSCARCGAT
jgi:hypothetical protein